MLSLLASGATETETAAETTAETTSEAVKGIDWANVWDTIWHWCTTDGIKLVVALIVLWISFKIVNFIFKKIAKTLEKRKADKTLSRTLVSISRKVVKFFLLLMFVGYIGIDTSSVVAAITAGAVTVGLALQGALSNLASGVLIICLRPFRVGDFIECAGLKGTVEEIGLFQTRMVSTDNKVLIVSNTNAINSAIVNYSMKDTRRVDMVFSIAYEEDFRKAKNIIREEIGKTGLALPDPEPFVNIKEHNTSSIDIEVRTWVKSDDYWDFYWAMLEDVKMAFDKNDISIPYNQLDVHLKDKESEKLQLEDDDKYVKAEIEHYKHTLSDKAVARKRRLAAEAAEKERLENKNIVKALIKKTKKKTEKAETKEKKTKKV